MNSIDFGSLNDTLSGFDGGSAVIWDTTRFNSAVVVSITAPALTNTRLFLDCIACMHVNYRPVWHPAKIRIEQQKLENGFIRISDGDSLQIECKTARLSVDNDGQFTHRYTCLAATRTPVDFIGTLIDRYPKSFSSIVAHFNGYSDALVYHNLPWNIEKPSLAAFREWIKLKLGWNMKTCGWELPITSTYPDDVDAAENFHRLYLEFRAEFDAGNVMDPPPREGYAT